MRVSACIAAACGAVHVAHAFVGAPVPTGSSGRVQQRHLSMSSPVAGKSLLKGRLIGSGSCAPPNTVSNLELEKVVETSDEWITTRTGIKNRHVLASGAGLSDIAAEAGRRAIQAAGVDASDIDLVILASSSPDDLFGDATTIAAAVGCSRGVVAFDLTAACSGFLFATVTASQFLTTGTYKRALVLGADALSRWVEWDDRNTCILFGDGAGAVVIEACEEADSGVLGFALHSDGGGHESLKLGYKGTKETPLGGGKSVTTGQYAAISMNGREVYKFATREVPAVLLEALDNAGLGVEDVDFLLLHQANLLPFACT
eukprot:TRINITY_DN2855_c0_g1_i4.p1 TRINITY_DN2855_c0_g1~~TRINITY_DN2855_c0_g1_i4.p1  ORF type:complete len:316 (-),score=100.87 TRINITY_DN2855_c0_g1_i4:98-1045(-)